MFDNARHKIVSEEVIEAGGVAIVAGHLVHDPTTNAIDEFDPEFYAKVAVEWADALIAKLKEK